MVSRRGGFLDQVDQFDSAFFNERVLPAKYLNLDEWMHTNRGDNPRIGLGNIDHPLAIFDTDADTQHAFNATTYCRIKCSR